MPTLLLIDDSPSQRAELRAVLEEAGFQCLLEASDGMQGLRMLLEAPIDLVVCDVEMPGLDGGKLVHMSRTAQGREIPFLMLTGIQDPARRARLFMDGACDVVTKPYHPVELVARVRLHLESVRLRNELVEKNHLLERLSATDELTGLWNRRHMQGALRVECMRARRYGTPLAVALVDLDHFKDVNDHHGHATGDQVLREVADVLKGHLRATDVAGRWGGEEFLVLLASDPEGAEVAAERWRLDLQERAVEVEGGAVVRVTMSVGIASLRADLCEPDALLGAADAALYEAKHAGRNCVITSRR